MKTRSGFVSNSSTSSFVVLGVEFDHDEYSNRELLEMFVPRDELDKVVKSCSHIDANSWSEANEDDAHEVAYLLQDDSDFILMDHEENGAPEGKKVIGIQIADGDPNEWCNISYSFDELREKAERIGCRRLPRRAEGHDLKIIVGTRMC